MGKVLGIAKGPHHRPRIGRLVVSLALYRARPCRQAPKWISSLDMPRRDEAFVRTGRPHRGASWLSVCPKSSVCMRKPGLRATDETKRERGGSTDG